MTLFVNGDKQGVVVGSHFVSDHRIFQIGAGDGINPQGFFSGLIAEVRISNIARYDKDFVPTARFEPDENTLALYHFDSGSGNKVLDASGNSHHGIIHGNVKWVAADAAFGEMSGTNEDDVTQPEPTNTSESPEPSKTNWALEFDGKSSHVVTDLRYDGSHPITIEAHVTPLALPQDDDGVGIVSNTQKAGVHLTLHVDFWRAAAYRAQAERSSIVASKQKPEVGKRVHVAGVYGDEKLTLYVGGRLAGSVESPGNHLASSLPFIIGAETRLRGPHWYFRGLIDEVKISKVARYDKDFTPAQRFEKDDDTVAFYHFDSGSGERLIDSSGNGHHGVIKGAKWVKVEDD